MKVFAASAADVRPNVISVVMVVSRSETTLAPAGSR
jgi:hypothetical protein